MALFHLSVTQTKRSAGQSAIASAAYRAGERLYSEYYGEYSDYTRKGGVICSDILLPSHAPPEYADRQTLWNAVEKAERGKNAQLAYSFDIALQNEFSLEENIALARRFLLENFVSRGMVVDFAVHQPDREDGGIPNPHFHVLCPIRPIEQDGMEPLNDAQASPRKKKKRDSFPQIPTWLEGHVKERKQKRLPTVTLCSSAGNELLEVWYYGDLLTVKGESQFYIIDGGEAPGLVEARDPESGEEFVIFDGGQHGYDNMFCDEHNPAQLAHRPLQRYEIPASKLVLELGYNIDYEDEKESFEVDEADTVELVNGERMPWEQVKRDGIDYIALYYVNDKGKQVQILDAELA